MKVSIMALFVYLVLDSGFEVTFASLVYSYTSYLVLCGVVNHGVLRNQLPLVGSIVENILIGYHLLKLTYRSIAIGNIAFVGGFLVATSIWYLLESSLFSGAKLSSSNNTSLNMFSTIDPKSAEGMLQAMYDWTKASTGTPVSADERVRGNRGGSAHGSRHDERKQQSDDEHLDEMLDRVNRERRPTQPLPNEKEKMLEKLTKKVVQTMGTMGLHPT